jgi:hypothetical protein
MEERRVTIDIPTVTADEALELMAHHLSLAAAYFEAIPTDAAANLAEVERLMTSDVERSTGKPYDEPRIIAARVWLAKITEVFKNMAIEQGVEVE